MEEERVAVLLSTYNGEKWLKEQIDSILNQTYSNIQIYVRDDGSTDNTLNILKEYEKEHKLVLICGDNKGYTKSFIEILRYVNDCQYYAFCDQDDIWFEDKIERAVKSLNERDNNKPLMYCSSYDFYDGEMNFIKHGKNMKKGPSFLNSLVDVIALGTCCVVNENARKEIIKATGDEICSHDWWIYFVCAGLGEVIYDDKASMKYRRHGNNTSFCGGPFIKLQVYRIKKFFLGNYFKNVKTQQIKYKEYYYDKLSKENKELLDLFTNEKYSIKKAFKKAFYPKMFRQNMIDEIIIRIIFLLGKV